MTADRVSDERLAEWAQSNGPAWSHAQVLKIFEARSLTTEEVQPLAAELQEARAKLARVEAEITRYARDAAETLPDGRPRHSASFGSIVYVFRRALAGPEGVDA